MRASSGGVAMEPKANVNVEEKKRLRDRIDEQVRHFLEAGGRITILESPREQSSPRGSAWEVRGDGSPLLD